MTVIKNGAKNNAQVKKGNQVSDILKKEEKKNVINQMKAVAEDVTAEEVKPTEQPQNPQAETPTPEQVQETKPETVQKAEIKKMPTLEEIKNRATVLYMLQEKHTELMQKKASLDRFQIKHDTNNAVVTIKDNNGLTFTSSSPKTISQLLDFWKEEFSEGINKIETQLMEQIQFDAVA